LVAGTPPVYQARQAEIFNGLLTVYWEHCGMLLDAGYRKRWELKLKWYRDNGVWPLSEDRGSGPNGLLVVTSDDPESGFDTTEITNLIGKVFGSS